MSRERFRRALLPPAQDHIAKIEKVIRDGNCYGAQQMYKSISARYTLAQRYNEALDILHSGACLQLENNQVTCGSELAVLFVETLVKAKIPYNEDSLDRVRKIYKLFPRVPLPHHLGDVGDDDDIQELNEALGAAKTRVECCSSFLKAAIRWSAEFGAHRNGSPELHVMMAEFVYSESPECDMLKVSYHYTRGNNPENFVSTIVNFMGKCYPGEDDLAIARAVLMYLAMGNLRDANFLMDEIKKQVVSKELNFPRSDLIQFIVFLLQTLQRDALPLFSMLREKYKSSIDREPAFNEIYEFPSFYGLSSAESQTNTIIFQFLDDIAEKFFGVIRRNPLQGMFGDIFKMMG